MPLITKKDKLAARSKTPRSRVVTTRVKREKPIVQSTIQPIKIEQKSTFAKREEIAITKKAELISPTIFANEKLFNIIGTRLRTINTIVQFLVLEEGESLKDIIISHYHGSGSSTVVSIHWSHLSEADFSAKKVTMISTDGIISADSDFSFRLITETFPSQSVLSIANNGLSDIFNEVDKNIYFYAVCSVLGPTITALKK